MRFLVDECTGPAVACWFIENGTRIGVSFFCALRMSVQ